MKTENKIIMAMLKEDSSFTIRELSKKINSDYKITHIAVKRLLQKNILKKKNVGKSLLCTLNRWSAAEELFFAEYERADEILKNKDLKQIYKEIMPKLRTSFFIMLLFGSFAKGNYHKNSDIDLLFISNEKFFENDIKRVLRLIPLKIHSLVFNENEFLKMLSSKEPNVVKEAVDNYIVPYGIENFYNLMRK